MKGPLSSQTVPHRAPQEANSGCPPPPLLVAKWSIERLYKLLKPNIYHTAGLTKRRMVRHALENLVNQVIGKGKEGTGRSFQKQMN